LLALNCVHAFKLLLHLVELNLLLLLNFLMVTNCGKEIILKRCNMQVLQQNGLVVFLYLRHQLCNLLLVYTSWPAIEKRPLNQLSSC
jgi:hypothetical protein